MTLLLTALIFSALLWENRAYLFATKLYENTDVASDSLMVREAKHSFLLHGHYSQWRFYHPGPALLDTLAAGEALFHDTLHLVPTPYNGQLIMLGLVMTFFFCLSVIVCADQLGAERGGSLFFLPVALVFAICHFGGVGGQVFLDAWPAYPLVMTFLCFLVSAAATASGEGRMLPVLVVAGGFLVHNHAAQPLFVVPLFLLAYGGLLMACRQAARAVGSPPHGRVHLLTAGWHEFPRAHKIAGVLLACFILPLGLDALHGRHSNLARILDYLRTAHGPHKRFVRSLCYFLTFGGYDAYQPGTRVFGRYSASGMLSFAGAHWSAFSCWAAALVGTPILFFVARGRLEKQPPNEAEKRPGHFLKWFFVMLAAAWGLTLVWGMKQDGPMYYYNAYFNYAIYYGLALGLAAALATALMAWTNPVEARRRRPMVAALLWLSVVGAAILQASHFRVSEFGTAEDAAMANTVERAAADLPKDAVCFVDCRPWASWRSAVAVTLELERLGHTVRVNDNWEIMFGNERTIQHERIGAKVPLARWMIAPEEHDALGSIRGPLLFGCNLDVKSLPEVPADGASIQFSRTGNFDDFAFYGWSLTDGDWTWSDQRSALLVFRPQPLPTGSGGVDLVIAAWTSPPPGSSDLQAVGVQFGDAMLGTVRLPLLGPDVQPVRVRVSAAQWQAAVARGEARLQFHFPDAQSPASLGLGADTRLLGGGFRRIEFRAVF